MFWYSDSVVNTFEAYFRRLFITIDQIQEFEARVADFRSYVSEGLYIEEKHTMPNQMEQQ